MNKETCLIKQRSNNQRFEYLLNFNLLITISKLNVLIFLYKSSHIKSIKYGASLEYKLEYDFKYKSIIKYELTSQCGTATKQFSQGKWGLELNPI